MSRLFIEALSLNYNRLFGYQEYLLNLLSYFKRHRKEIKSDSITILCKDIDKHVFEPFTPEINIVAFNANNKWKRYYILNTLKRRLRLNNNDVILFTNNYSALTKQCKHILVIHDLLYLRREWAPNRAFCLQRSMFVPRSARIADKIVSISKWVKDDIVSHFHVSENKVVPIYNYFDFSKFNEGAVSEKIKNICDLGNYFLIVCSNAKHKNTITALKSFNQYRRQNGVKRLIVIGRFSSDLLAYVNRLDDNVQSAITNIHGISNAELGYVYKHAYCYISTTLFEGLGMPIVEAMYFGLPCIVSDIPVLREVTDGQATYVQPMDVNALTSYMLTTVKSDQQSNSQMKSIEDKFCEENTSHKYISLFNSLLGGGRLIGLHIYADTFCKERRAA